MDTDEKNLKTILNVNKYCKDCLYFAKYKDTPLCFEKRLTNNWQYYRTREFIEINNKCLAKCVLKGYKRFRNS